MPAATGLALGPAGTRLTEGETLKTIECGCLCGAVRYTVSAEPIMTRACWCRVCQYFASGNSTINVVFPKDALKVIGELKDYASDADSGNRMHRRFCPACGTQMFSESEARPHLIIVRAGTLDDPELAKASGVIWTKSAPSWAHIDPDVPHFEGQPPAPAPDKPA
jgi:hypothetical protein